MWTYLVVGLVIGLVVGAGTGYYAAQKRVASTTTTPAVTTTSAKTPAVAPSPFTVGAAGTLKFAFTGLLNLMGYYYPGVTLGQPLFAGSGEVAREEATTQVFSLVASADTTTIPSVLFPNYANYEIAFGVTQMVIIVDLETSAGKEVYSLWRQAQQETPFSAQWNQTWREIFNVVALYPNTTVGVSNPFTDPSGYQAQCVLKLAGLAFMNNASYYWVVLEANYSSYTLASSNISPSYVEGLGVGMVYVGAPLNVNVWVSPESPAQGQSITIYANITYSNGTPVKYGQFSAVLVPEADLGAFESLALSGVNVPLYYNSGLGLWVGNATMPSPFSPGSTAFSGLYAGEPWAVVVTGNAFNGVPAAGVAIAQVAETKYVYYTGVLTPGSFYPYNGLFYNANITGFNGTIEDSVFEGNVYIVDSNVTIADSQSYGTIYVVNSNVSLVNVMASRVVVVSGVANIYISDVISSVSGHVNYIVTLPQVTALVSSAWPSIMQNLSALWSEVSELQQEYSALNSTVSGLSSAVSKLASEASQLSTKVSELSEWLLSNVSAVNRTVTGLGNSLSALNSTVSGLSSAVSELTSEASQLSTKVSELQQEYSALNSTVSGLSSAVSNISSRVSSISTTATTAYSGASRSFSLGVGVAAISVISLAIAAVALSRRH